MCKETETWLQASGAKRIRQSRKSMGRTSVHDFIESVLNPLRVLKEEMTYSRMEASSGIHSTLLCRYVTASTGPSIEQSGLLERTFLRKSWFKERVREKITITASDYSDPHAVTWVPNALKWISADITSQFSEIQCDRILTTASSGISLATAIALEMRRPIVHATDSKSSGTNDYYETVLHSRNPSEISTLYIPKKLLKKGETVLIVDDVARRMN